MRAFLRHHLGTNSPIVTFALYASTDQTAGELPEQLLFDNRMQSPAREAGSDAFHRVPDISSSRTRKVRDGVDRDSRSEHPFWATDSRGLGSQSVLTGSMRVVRDLPLYGRLLRFVLEPGPALASALNERTLWLAASFGVTTTLLLSGFIAYQTRTNRKEREISAALRQSEARLQSLL